MRYTNSLRLLLAFCALSAVRPGFGQAPPVVAWQNCLGGSAEEQPWESVVLADGGMVVSGYTKSSDGDVLGYHGNTDAWVVRLDSSGAMLWQVCLGGSEEDQATSIGQTQDGGFIVAGFTESVDGDVNGQHGDFDGWVVKLDEDGNMDWQLCVGGSDLDELHSIAELSDGSYAALGRTTSTDGDITAPLGGNDAWFVRIDQAGTLLWEKCLGGSGEDWGYEVQPTPDYGFIIIAQVGSNDGDVSGNHGPFDMWVAKLTADASVEWQLCVGGSSNENARGIVQTMDGGYAVVGHGSSTNGDCSCNHSAFHEDVVVAKLSAVGELLWIKCLGGSGADQAHAMLERADGGFVVTGFTNSTDGDVSGIHGGGGTDLWVAELDVTGELLGQKCFGGLGYEYGWCVGALDAALFVVGQSDSENFDVAGNHGGKDVWVARLTDQYNMVQGSVFADLNEDLVQDPTDPPLAFHMLQESNTERLAFTFPNGNYELTVLDTGDYEVAAASIPYYTPAAPVQPVSFETLLDTLAGIDFQFQPDGSSNDLQITLFSLSAFRPGYSAFYRMHIRNIGSTTLDPIVAFVPDDAVQFFQAWPPPTGGVPDSLLWSLTGLSPFADTTLVVQVTVNTDAVLGETVISEAFVFPVFGDAAPEDNHSEWPAIVTGSYDPNDIQVNRSALNVLEIPGQPPLDYLIRFQNTGTDTAFTVRIENTPPSGTALLSLQILDTSHPMAVEYHAPTDRLVFLFSNILLPDSNTNEPESHGYVLYRMRTLSTLLLGDSVQNTASIFFDYNDPVLTNTAVTVVDASTSIRSHDTDLDISLTPNPVRSIVYLQTQKPIVDAELLLCDPLGRVLFSDRVSGTTTALDLSALPDGPYLVILRSESGQYHRRLIKN